MTNLITRKEYLNSRGDSSASHRAYYRQFVTPAHFDRLKSIGIKNIQSSADKHFNDIPLKKWDTLAVPVPVESARLLKECGDYATLSGAVCILKEAAQQVREGRGITTNC